MRTFVSTPIVWTILLAGALAAGLLQGCAGVLVAGGAGAAAATVDRRTAGTILEDESIELKIRTAIFSDKEMESRSHINITSYNNVVLLTGEAPTADMRNQAVNRAREAEKVKRVYNEIVVAEPSSVKARSTDTWITTKVKAALVGTSEINAVHVKVITEGGSVYLLGLLTREEANIAARVASGVEGAQRVVKLFEYID